MYLLKPGKGILGVFREQCYITARWKQILTGLSRVPGITLCTTFRKSSLQSKMFSSIFHVATKNLTGSAYCIKSPHDPDIMNMMIYFALTKTWCLFHVKEEYNNGWYDCIPLMKNIGIDNTRALGHFLPYIWLYGPLYIHKIVMRLSLSRS